MADEQAVSSGDKVESQIKEKKWQNTQVRAFKHWVDTFLEKRAMKIQVSLQEDFGDGLTIIHFLEVLTGQKLKKRYNKNPKMRPIYLENCSLALTFLQECGVDAKYITISAENLVDKNPGDLRFLLGFLWMLFRHFRLQTTQEEGQSTEDGLLSWIRQITEGYEGVDIKDFKTSFSNGLPFLAMIDKFDPEILDYNNMMQEYSTEQNIKAALELAEKHLGIPQLLDPEELLNGTADERSIVLYNSLFFHAFMSKEETDKKEQKLKSTFHDEKKELSTQVEELTMQLQSVNEAKEVLEANLSESKREMLEQKEEYEKTVQQRDAKIEELEQENEDLNDELREWKAKYNKLCEKMEEGRKNELAGLDILRKNLLEHMTDMNTWKDYLEQDRDYESEKIQLKAEEDIKARPVDGQLLYLSESLESENRKLQALLKQHEIEEAENPEAKKKSSTKKGSKEEKKGSKEEKKGSKEETSKSQSMSGDEKGKPSGEETKEEGEDKDDKGASSEEASKPKDASPKEEKSKKTRRNTKKGDKKKKGKKETKK